MWAARRSCVTADMRAIRLAKRLAKVAVVILWAGALVAIWAWPSTSRRETNDEPAAIQEAINLHANAAGPPHLLSETLALTPADSGRTIATAPSNLAAAERNDAVSSAAADGRDMMAARSGATTSSRSRAFTQDLANMSSVAYSRARASTALWLMHLPAFPVRCRSDLAHLYRQMASSSGSPLTERAGAIGLVQAQLSQANLDAPSYHVSDELSWLPAGTRKLPLLCSSGCVPNRTLNWLHFDGNIHDESTLLLALDEWYAALAPGGLLSGGSFLNHDSKRQPLISTCRRSKQYPNGYPLFKHKQEYEYRHRLAMTNHSVRSAVKRFARKHDLLTYVTYFYDCNDDPTWYIVKPAVVSLVNPTRRSSQIGFCKDYELHPSLAQMSKAMLASQNSSSSISKFHDATRRLVRTESFPLRCRDDLLRLAAELGLNGTAAEVGNGTGVKFDLSNAEVANVWSDTMRLHKSRQEFGNNIASARSPGSEMETPLDRRLRLPLPTRLARASGATSHLDWFLAMAQAGSAARVSASDLPEESGFVAKDSLDWVHITDLLPTRRAIATELKAWWPKLRSGGILSGDDFIDRCDQRRPLDSKSVTFEGAFEDEMIYRQRPSKRSYGVRRAVKEWVGSQVLMPVSVTYMYDCYSEPVWYAIKP